VNRAGATNEWYNATGDTASGILVYDPATGTTDCHDTASPNQIVIVYLDGDILDAGFGVDRDHSQHGDVLQRVWERRQRSDRLRGPRDDPPEHG
jgi:hypothetical protein